MASPSGAPLDGADRSACSPSPASGAWASGASTSAAGSAAASCRAPDCALSEGTASWEGRSAGGACGSAPAQGAAGPGTDRARDASPQIRRSIDMRFIQAGLCALLLAVGAPDRQGSAHRAQPVLARRPRLRRLHRHHRSARRALVHRRPPPPRARAQGAAARSLRRGGRAQGGIRGVSSAGGGKREIQPALVYGARVPTRLPDPRAAVRNVLPNLGKAACPFESISCDTSRASQVNCRHVGADPPDTQRHLKLRMA